MADPEQREKESRESDVTKYDEVQEEIREEHEEAAKRVREPLEPRDDDDA